MGKIYDQLGIEERVMLGKCGLVMWGSSMGRLRWGWVAQ